MLKAVLNEAWKLAPFRVAVVHNMIHEFGKAVSMMTDRASSETATPFFFSSFDTSSILLIPFANKTYITIHSIFMSNLFLY